MKKLLEISKEWVLIYLHDFPCLMEEKSCVCFHGEEGRGRMDEVFFVFVLRVLRVREWMGERVSDLFFIFHKMKRFVGFM